MKNVLIVDDSRTSRRILKDILERAGYNIVGEAINGKEGFTQYAKLQPDIVTMDITMPEMDGIEALKHIKEDFPELYDQIDSELASAAYKFYQKEYMDYLSESPDDEPDDIELTGEEYSCPIPEDWK